MVSLKSSPRKTRPSSGQPPTARPLLPLTGIFIMLFRTIFASAIALFLMAFPLITVGEAMSETQLHNAAKQNDAVLVIRLLADGAEIDARDGSGATALLAATHANAVEVARILIQAGSDVNAKDNQ